MQSIDNLKILYVEHTFYILIIVSSFKYKINNYKEIIVMK